MTKHKVLCGDCVELLPKHGPYDFIFVDSPFNIGQKYNGYEDNIDDWEFSRNLFNWVSTSYENLTSTGILCLHGPDSLCEMYLDVAKQRGYKRIAWVNWHYRFGQCGRGNWIDARCHCLIYAKDPKNYTWNPEDVLVESDRVAYGDKRVHETENGGKRLPGTVWGIPSDGPYWGRVPGNSKERREGHPNQLPEVYLERLVRAYTNPGDLVCDPFGGSGTSSVVAKALGRNSVTMDISKESVKSIMRRLKTGAIRV